MYLYVNLNPCQESAMFDLLLKNLWLEDPVNAYSGNADIGIENGKISRVEPEISLGAQKTIDMNGALAIPGIIDIHTHVSGDFGDPVGFAMLARAGVCTALNMAGPVDDALKAMPQAYGLNMAALQDVAPGKNLSSTNPDKSEIARIIDKSLTAGALGIKLLGGHYPLTPDASAEVARQTINAGAYMAWHAGTTTAGSNIEGLKELVELAGDLPVHVAHINSYCRGQILPELEEVALAASLLESHPDLYSESYISAANGTSFFIGEDGKLASKSTAFTFGKLGYENSARGVAMAIEDGVAYVLTRKNDEMARITGHEGVILWQKAGSRIAGSLDVNPAASRLALLLARRKCGDFVVDCLSTDGGSIPRNVIISDGYPLVRAHALSIRDYALKTSFNPSYCLHLPDKGHLGPGADADVTIIDPLHMRAKATIVGGKISMLDGQLFQSPGTVITTRAGLSAVRGKGLKAICVDVSGGPMKFRKC